MNIIFSIIIFLIGSLIGSFYAAIIEAILNNKSLSTVYSYCTECGEKLGFFEKIPIISYIFLKGKCKHCKQKIASKYIILEIITGLLFLIMAYGLNIINNSFNITNVVLFLTTILYVSYIILVAGIDKKERNISQPVLTYGIIISIIYIIYMCIAQTRSIYVNVVYLVIMTLLLLANVISTKKRAQGSYIIDLLTMLLIMLIFTGEFICILTITETLVAIALYILINKLVGARNKSKKSRTAFNLNIRMAFIMGSLNIVTLVILMIYKIFF